MLRLAITLMVMVSRCSRSNSPSPSNPPRTCPRCPRRRTRPCFKRLRQWTQARITDRLTAGLPAACRRLRD